MNEAPSCSMNDVLPLQAPTDDEWPTMWALAERLHELGYTEHAVSKAMGLEDHSLRNFAAWPSQVRNCRLQKKDNPVALLAALFMIEESVDDRELKAVLGAPAVDLLEKMNWLARNAQDKLYFRYFLYPLLGSLVLTDGSVSNPNHPNHVYYLGSDSHCLARMAPRPKVSSHLDHCTGSGGHAVLARGHTERSVGLDINPRALHFASMNARWNRHPDAMFVGSDCYQNVKPELLEMDRCEFDLITANPPFVPTPEAISLCRGGGITGEHVTEKIVRGLPQYLSAEGIFSMVTNVPVFRDHTFFQRCENWLASDENWTIIDLSYHVWSLPAYVLAHQDMTTIEDYGERFQRWLDAYESVGLRALTNSQTYLFRSPFPWRIERTSGYPGDCVAPFVESWFAALRAYRPEGGVRYRLNPALEKIWWQEGRARVYLEWRDDHRWWQPTGQWLEGEEAKLLAQFQDLPEGLEVSGSDSVALRPLLRDHLVTLA